MIKFNATFYKIYDFTLFIELAFYYAKVYN